MKKIITISFDIPGYSEESYKPYSSSQSLLDADIIVFEPDFSSYTIRVYPVALRPQGSNFF